MQKLFALTITAMALFAPMSEVEGQSNTKPVLAPASRTVNLTAEQRFILKEIVYKDLKTPKAQAGAPETIGDPVPANVELHDMTPELAEKVPQAKSHKFYVTADAIVLVSPSDQVATARLSPFLAAPPKCYAASSSPTTASTTDATSPAQPNHQPPINLSKIRDVIAVLIL
jgi:hypothetical protein